MFRTAPLWYRDGMPSILTILSQVLTQDNSVNLCLLPSFPTPDYVADGAHLTPFSGLEFLLHLFDQAKAPV